jgi:hypothetical protein
MTRVETVVRIAIDRVPENERNAIEALVAKVSRADEEVAAIDTVVVVVLHPVTVIAMIGEDPMTDATIEKQKPIGKRLWSPRLRKDQMMQTVNGCVAMTGQSPQTD